VTFFSSRDVRSQIRAALFTHAFMTGKGFYDNVVRVVGVANDRVASSHKLTVREPLSQDPWAVQVLRERDAAPYETTFGDLPGPESRALLVMRIVSDALLLGATPTGGTHLSSVFGVHCEQIPTGDEPDEISPFFTAQDELSHFFTAVEYHAHPDLEAKRLVAMTLLDDFWGGPQNLAHLWNRFFQSRNDNFGIVGAYVHDDRLDFNVNGFSAIETIDQWLETSQEHPTAVVVARALFQWVMQSRRGA
jgi:hypothetical protein